MDFHRFIPVDRSTVLQFQKTPLSPVVRESLQLYPTGAAPVWVRGCGSLCCRERARIQGTVVGYVAGILIFMKTKHFGPA